MNFCCSCPSQCGHAPNQRVRRDDARADPADARHAGRPAGPDQEERWAFEMKWDGVRAVVYLDDGGVRVLTRNDREVASTYPELAGLGDALCARAAWCWTARSWRSTRTGAPASASCRRACTCSGRRRELLADGAGQPAGLRRVLPRRRVAAARRPMSSGGRLLEELDVNGARWATPPAFDGDGAAALAASHGQGLEGVLAKRRDSSTSRASGRAPGSRSSTSACRRW